jgi:hypothetical protein
MANPPLLYDELTLEDKVYLANLTLHEGYKVLKRLMSAACTRATEAVIKLDPMDADYGRKVQIAQQQARDRNEFCSSVLKSIEFHTLTAAVESDK